MEDNIYPKVHIIVLNWNNKELTEQCLLSIQRIDYPNYEILIVDNNSSDGSIELFKNNFPDVKLLSLDKNLKYAGGNNAAIDYLSFNEDDFFLFLNNDTLVSRDFLHYLINPFLNDPDCIISVPKILFSKDTNRVWYAGGVVSFWKGIINHIGIREFDGPRYSFPMETMYATGCCLCIKASDFEKLNRFDNTFTMYCEDVDLSVRAKQGINKIKIVTAKPNAGFSNVLYEIPDALKAVISLSEDSFPKVIRVVTRTAIGIANDIIHAEFKNRNFIIFRIK